MEITLKINEEEYKGKASFAFIKSVETLGKLNEETAKFEGGVETLLTSLITGEAEALVDFWKAATAHYKLKEQPSKSVIERAIENEVEGGKDLEDMLKEAYQFMAQSGFFKRKVRTFWENFEMAKTLGKTEEENKQNLMMYDHMMKMKKQIEA